ncbi:hypothetical protein LTR62_004340 [Meristemomyces frigidus]|uniref:3-hydroxyisobutyrate dehydrogenase n=1 Tax=Meristemomyces frigidus TaxID=1508187 RepID=A0AAN7YGB8_9PEZI|nr:hypothetical protein LTR62_004340 [Meristemomyces frigidus]
MPKNIGWIGLGAMGFPMCLNLVKKLSSDTHFYVNDVVQGFVDKFVQEGGQTRIHACASAKEVADKSDIILSMVPEGSHVRAVYLTPETGLLASNLASKILIDCSTIDTGTSLAVRDDCASSHPRARFYDAPVSGGVSGAEKATLTFMLGSASSNPDLPFLQHLLGLMGGNIFPCGGASLGLTAKLCNNYTSAMISVATSEAMIVGMKAGMDPRVLANIFHTSTAQSAICDDWCPVPGVVPGAPSSRDYKGGFKIALMKKDVGLAVETAGRLGVEVVLGRPGLGVYEEAAADPRCEGLDSRVVYRFLGGREDWREGFPEEVEMRSQETRRLVREARERGL